MERQVREENWELIASLRAKIDDLEKEASDVNDLKENMILLEKENKHVRKMARSGNSQKLHENDVAMVVELTKRFIYPKCQYIDGELQLTKVMKILSRKQNMAKDKHEDFNMNFRDVVLKTINQMRNASVQSMRRMYNSKCMFVQFIHFKHTILITYLFNICLFYRYGTQTHLHVS